MVVVVLVVVVVVVVVVIIYCSLVAYFIMAFSLEKFVFRRNS